VTITTDIPSRLDRLPFSRWHWRMVIALGITWVLDGLEVTLVGSLGSALADPNTLGFTPTQVGASASAYLLGAVVGAVVFGRLADRHGRKRLFLVTLGLYLTASAATALSWNFWSFCSFRLLTGMGIGGECAAMNSAIDELVPARVRGFTALTLNGTYWLGAALGATASAVLLRPGVLGLRWGWRACFGLGALMGLVILPVRRSLPESPRWLMFRGRAREAERVTREIESHVAAEHELPPPGPAVAIHAGAAPSLRDVARVLGRAHLSRTVLGLSLMIAQAFFYNAVFFTYALVLSRFYGVPAEHVGWYLIPFAAGNALGPFVLGRLFDDVGRRRMIVFTYGVSGIFLAVTGWLFAHGWLDAFTQTIAWSVIFFVASAAASSAYLTVSEIFPLQMRSLAIALFYAIGVSVGGLVAPSLFGALISTGRRQPLAAGYGVAALLLGVAALVAWRFAVDAERKPLEEIASWSH
jgi:MFS family permease